MSTMEMLQAAHSRKLKNMWFEAIKEIKLDAHVVFTKGKDEALKLVNEKMWLISKLISSENSTKSSPPQSITPISNIESSIMNNDITDDTISKTQVDPEKESQPYRPSRESIRSIEQGYDDKLTAYADMYLKLPHAKTMRGHQRRLKKVLRVLGQFGPRYCKGVTGFTPAGNKTTTIHIVFNCMTLEYTSRGFTKEDSSNLKTMIDDKLKEQAQLQRDSMKPSLQPMFDDNDDIPVAKRARISTNDVDDELDELLQCN